MNHLELSSNTIFTLKRSKRRTLRGSTPSTDQEETDHPKASWKLIFLWYESLSKNLHITFFEKTKTVNNDPINDNIKQPILGKKYLETILLMFDSLNALFLKPMITCIWFPIFFFWPTAAAEREKFRAEEEKRLRELEEMVSPFSVYFHYFSAWLLLFISFYISYDILELI